MTRHLYCTYYIHADIFLDEFDGELFLGLRFHLFTETTEFEKGAEEIIFHSHSIELLGLLVESQVLQVLKSEGTAYQVRLVRFLKNRKEMKR